MGNEIRENVMLQIPDRHYQKATAFAVIVEPFVLPPEIYGGKTIKYVWTKYYNKNIVALFINDKWQNDYSTVNIARHTAHHLIDIKAI